MSYFSVVHNSISGHKSPPSTNNGPPTTSSLALSLLHCTEMFSNSSGQSQPASTGHDSNRNSRPSTNTPSSTSALQVGPYTVAPETCSDILLWLLTARGREYRTRCTEPWSRTIQRRECWIVFSVTQLAPTTNKNRGARAMCTPPPSL